VACGPEEGTVECMNIVVTPGGPLGCDGEELDDGFFCRTPEDECANDLDCADHEDGRRCAYSPKLERWACSAYAW
jgi:hypothetical protein